MVIIRIFSNLLITLVQYSLQRYRRNARLAQSCPNYNFTSFVRQNHTASHLLPRTCRDDWLPGKDANIVLDFPGVNQATGTADRKGARVVPTKKWDSSKSITRYGIANVYLTSLYHTELFVVP